MQSVRRGRARCRPASGRREPRRPLHHRGAFINQRGTYQLSRALDYLPAARGSGQRNSSFVHVSTDEGMTLGPNDPPFREDCLRPQFALSATKALVRPSRCGPNIRRWPARDDDELLEQLRTVPISGEADSADDPPRLKAERGLLLWHDRRLQRMTGSTLTTSDGCARSRRARPAGRGRDFRRRRRTNLDVVQRRIATASTTAGATAAETRSSAVPRLTGTNCRYAILFVRRAPRLGWRPQQTTETRGGISARCAGTAIGIGGSRSEACSPAKSGWATAQIFEEAQCVMPSDSCRWTSHWRVSYTALSRRREASARWKNRHR